MWHEERHARIRDLLQAFGQVSVERITADLGVSRETIRRDLLELEARGEIRRVHGGAVLTGDEPPIDVRAATRVKEKRLIAKKVASLVEGGQTLFMDAGSTVTLIAEALATRSGLTIITNSVEVASRFAAGQGEAGSSSGANQVHLLGGRFNGAISATYGPATIAEIARFQPHLAILSPVGIDAEYGASSVEMDEAEIARAMCTHARRVLIAADHAKIGVRSRVGYCPLKQVDVLVTDRRAVRSKVIQNIAASVGSVEYA
jgi:DeoR family fructose operon transcriptional repressor